MYGSNPNLCPRSAGGGKHWRYRYYFASYPAYVMFGVWATVADVYRSANGAQFRRNLRRSDAGPKIKLFPREADCAGPSWGGSVF